MASGVRRDLWCLVAVTLVIVASCGDDGGDDEPATSEAPVSSPSGSIVPPSTAGECDFDGGTGAVEGAAEGGPLLLTGVRAARQPCFDRVVLEFGDPGAPGYRVSYVEGPITQDGSGDPVAVAGAAFLEVRVEPASGFDLDAGAPSYDGPVRIEPGDTEHVEEVVRSGDFEAVLTWVVGLDEQRPFTVDVLADPTRLVVDIG